jgi:hypothetical protein
VNVSVHGTSLITYFYIEDKGFISPPTPSAPLPMPQAPAPLPMYDGDDSGKEFLQPVDQMMQEMHEIEKSVGAYV